MDSKVKIMLAAVAGAAFGAVAVQGLHAQAKPKAYLVSESEILDAAAAASYGPVVAEAQKGAGGRSFRTTGKIVAVMGTAPKRVGISEWDSLEKAQGWFNSEARKKLEPQREKSIKLIRQYIVEAAN